MKKLYILLLSLLCITCSTSRKNNGCITSVNETETRIPYLVGSTRIAGYPFDVQFIEGNTSTDYPLLRHLEKNRAKYKGWIMYDGKSMSKVKNIRCNSVNNICILTIVGDKYSSVIQTPKAEILVFGDNLIAFNDGYDRIIELRRN